MGELVPRSPGVQSAKRVKLQFRAVADALLEDVREPDEDFLC